MRAPLIAVISVGIAAAAPAVAVSATANSGAGQRDVAASPVTTDLNQPLGPVTLEKTNTNKDIRHRRLVRRFLKLRNRTNRLIAKRDRRKPRIVRTAVQARWSNAALTRQIRILRKRIKRLRAALRARQAGLTAGVRAMLERIAFCESKGNPRAIGGGGAFRGKYQFTYGTWRAVGGHGDPAAAPEAEQDLRAALLLKRGGTSPWPVCG
jgi:hypothetical protein